MESLLKNLEEKYIDYIKRNEKLTNKSLKETFIHFLKEKNLDKRMELWNNFSVNINSIKQIPQLANPYFIGFGNPQADVLFIGKEKAFNIHSSPLSFLHESVNNTLQWKKLIENDTATLSPFDPKNPRSYHAGKIKAVHTWGKYAQIIAEMKGIKTKPFLKAYEIGDNTFFDHCFLTEINHIPSRYSKGKKASPVRVEFLKNSFYKRFKYVFIGARPYLSHEQIMEIFQVDMDPKKIILGYKGKKKDKPIVAHLFKTKTQTIIYCGQLSGAAGWTNEAIENLVTTITST